MRELAKRPHVCCKLSGLVTEADWQQWTPANLEPYWRVVLEAFGPDRLLFGSDWPVSMLATGYQRWVDTVTEWVAPLSASEQDAIWSGERQPRLLAVETAAMPLICAPWPTFSVFPEGIAECLFHQSLKREPPG